MDQIRTALAWLKKYHFWVLTVLVALIGVVSWYASSGALSKEFKANQSTIQTAFSTPQQLASQPFHPNDLINDKQKDENRKRARSVAAIWQQLYDRQRNEVLKWPETLIPEFREYVAGLKFGQEIPIRLRQHYQDYIQRYFPELPKKIQARILEGDGRDMRIVLDRDQVIIEENYVCDWLDQQAVRDDLRFEETPSSLQIWVTQENLWAYDTLLNVIAATNASVGADRPGNAAVKTIHSLEVGKKAANVKRNNRIDLSPSVRATNLAGAAEGDGRSSGNETEFMSDGRGSGGTISPEQERAMLLSGRYVDQDGKPITFDGASADFRSAFGTEYKRLPVRLVLEMDVRSLSFLITECANQPLQVEVQEVRINPSDAGDTGNRTAVFDTASRSGSGEIQAFPANPHLLRVVIQGVIYIFNEPNLDILKEAEGAAVAANN